MDSLSGRLKIWFAEKRQKVEPVDSWIALFASVMTYFHVMLVSASFGIIYDDLIDKFDATRSDVGWAFSIYWMCLCLAGLFFSPFIISYGCKVVSFVGGLLFGSGLILAAFAPNLIVFCLLYGGVTGIGSSCAFISGSAIIQQVFTDNRGFATGLIAVGCSLGGLVHPFHTRLLLDQYGLFGVLLIHGAISLHMSLYAFAYKTTTDKKRSKNKPQAQGSTNNQLSATIDEHQKIQPIDKKINETIDHPKLYQSTNEQLNTTSDKPMPVYAISQSANLNEDHISDKTTTLTTIRGCIHLVQTVQNGNSLDQPNMHGYEDSNRTGQDDDNEAPANKKTPSHLTFKTYCLGILDFTPLKNLNFMLCSLHFLLLFTVRLGMTSQLVSAATLNGTALDRAAYLLSISAFGNLIAKLCASILMNFDWLNPMLFSGFAALVLSASAFLPAYETSYVALAFSAVLVGIGDAISLGNFPLLIVQTLDLTRFTRGMSIAWALTVPAPIGATPFTGWLADRTGDYTLAFSVLGGIGLASSAMAVIIYLMIREDKRKQSKSSAEPADIDTRL